MKKYWSRAALVAAFVLAAGSCGLREIGGTAEESIDGGIWGGPVTENDGAGILEQVCYVTALDYQKGYDWRADQARESVKCSLVVYADGRPVMKVPVGEEYETGSDPDMHRMIDGHLYTDYSTSSETVIKKDGAQIFRYAGRETICGVEVSGGDVYTLGQNRSGEGFSFRKNGEVVMSRDRGSVIGRLRQDNDSMSFAFYESIKSSDGDVDRYYVARNGKVSQIAVRDDIKKVWDVMCGGSSLLYVASLTGVAVPVLFINGSMTTLALPKNSVLHSVTLFGDSEKPGVEILYSSGSGMYCSFWMNGVSLITFQKGQTVSAMCWQDSGVCCAINPSNLTSSGTIYRCGELHDMPRGYSCVGRDAICMVNGMLNIGLSSYDGSSPLIWKDGETETLKINGYIASISAH